MFVGKVKMALFGPKKRSFVLGLIPLIASFGLIRDLHADLETKDQLADSVEQIISRMSLEEKVSQLFIFGFRGAQPSQRLAQIIQKEKPGALIVFKRNVKTPYQIASFNHWAHEQSQNAVGLPFLIMIDQEGGSVTRIRTRPLPPSALSIGKTKNPEVAFNVGKVTGKILRTLGFNSNLAPVADLSDPQKRNFIGSRSFGKDPQLVTDMISEYSKGLMDEGVLPTIKHFPGHGGSVKDSHKSLPYKDKTLEELKKSDLIPFMNFSKLPFLSATMVAHIAYPQIDPSGRPATFSKSLVSNLLKNTLQYKGLIITDDIEMAAAKKVGGMEERAIQAFEAGSDMIMVAWSRYQQKRARRALIQAVKTGRISKNRIDESLRKIVATKLTLRQSPAMHLPDKRTLHKQLGKSLKELRQLTNQISRIHIQKSLKSHADLKGQLSPTSPLYVFSADVSFYKKIKENIKNPVSFNWLRKNRTLKIHSKFKKNPNAIGVFYISGTGTARILNKINPTAAKKLIVINGAQPGLVKNPQKYRAVVPIYSRNHNVGRWIAEYLTKQATDERTPTSEEDWKDTISGF